MGKWGWQQMVFFLIRIIHDPPTYPTFVCQREREMIKWGVTG